MPELPGEQDMPTRGEVLFPAEYTRSSVTFAWGDRWYTHWRPRDDRWYTHWRPWRRSFLLRGGGFMRDQSEYGSYHPR